jgi:succinate dehydrogenase / fumarate reductase flavoprotein subunit
MQGLADGYFVIPYTIGHYLAAEQPKKHDTSHAAFKQTEAEVVARIDKLFGIPGKRTVSSFHRELGNLLWEYCGMARNAAGLKKALELIPALRERFWREARVLGGGDSFNQGLERAGRVADFLEFGELMCRDALLRDESCGGHFREEHQTEDGEALRDDERFTHAAVWEYKGQDSAPVRHTEPLVFENVKLATRSYK